MTHLNGDDLVEAYYSGLTSEMRTHLDECSECGAYYRKIADTLDFASEETIPQREADYGARVWARLSPQLPPERRDRWQWSRLVLAAAALTAILLGAGVWAGRTRMVPEVTSNQQAAATTPNVALREVAPKTSARPKLTVSKHQKAKASATVVKVSGDEDAQSDSIAMHQSLEDFASRSPDVPTQAKAIRVMATTGSKGLAGLYVTSSNPTVKHQILNVMVSAGDSDTTLELLHREKDPQLRVSAINSLPVMPVSNSILLRLYRTDNSKLVRDAVLDALVKQRNEKALSELAGEEADSGQRLQILRRLYQFGKSTDGSAQIGK